MTREEAITELLRSHQPLGPFREPEEPDEQQVAWAATANEDALEAMFALAADPPTTGQIGRLSPEEFEFEVSRMLSLLEPHHPDAFLNLAQPLLRSPAARPTLIDALGMMRSPATMALLASLVPLEGLSEEEIARLASAVGERGGPDAPHLLAQLRERTPPAWTAVRDEIEIALRYARPH